MSGPKRNNDPCDSSRWTPPVRYDRINEFDRQHNLPLPAEFVSFVAELRSPTWVTWPASVVINEKCH